MAFTHSKTGAVIIVGAGFAGLTAAIALSRLKPKPEIILVEPRKQFVFLPLLYELLSGELKSWEVAPSYHSLLSDRGIVLLEDFVEGVDFAEKFVITSSGLRIKYSEVIISTGSETHDFGIPGVREHAIKFSSFEDVQLLKLLIRKVNLAENCVKTLAIVGAGATGVELACKLADLTDNDTKIHLIESGPRVLSQGKSFNQEQSELSLKKRKVQLHLSTNVVQVFPDTVKLVKGEDDQDVHYLNHQGLIWTAGTKPVFPSLIPQISLNSGRILVDETLQVVGQKGCFALGDIAYFQDEPLKRTAQVAVQQGEAVAENIMLLRLGESLKPFNFVDLGEMLSLGIGDATITGLGFTFAGPKAFHMRRMAYLTKMPRISLGIRSAGAWLLDS